jgi:hypothetical protein
MLCPAHYERKPLHGSRFEALVSGSCSALFALWHVKQLAVFTKHASGCPETAEEGAHVLLFKCWRAKRMQAGC